MNFDGPHTCPRCQFPINVEDHGESVEDGGAKLIVYLYCDSCSLGVERLYERKGGSPAGGGFWSFVIEALHDVRKPRALAKFLSNLRAARQCPTVHDAPVNDAPAEEAA